MNQPDVSAIIVKLRLVLNGDLSREEVSDWASSYVMADSPTIDDEMVWDLLKIVSGIDLLDSPMSYLYSEKDIIDWIKQAKKFQ